MTGGMLRIGVDFDNTIVSYDSVIRQLAREHGLIEVDEVSGKKDIRDLIHQREGGEIEWQKIQGVIYGPRMWEARLIDGVPEFFARCRQRQACVFIVSHKTQFARYDLTRTPLRKAAHAWMEREGFFLPTGLGLSCGEVFFESTRERKIARIRELGCTHFIDDLEEVFADEGFPLEVAKILFARQGCSVTPSGVWVASSWQEITTHLFGEGD